MPNGEKRKEGEPKGGAKKNWKVEAKKALDEMNKLLAEAEEMKKLLKKGPNPDAERRLRQALADAKTKKLDFLNNIPGTIKGWSLSTWYEVLKNIDEALRVAQDKVSINDWSTINAKIDEVERQKMIIKKHLGMG